VILILAKRALKGLPEEDYNDKAREGELIYRQSCEYQFFRAKLERLIKS